MRSIPELALPSVSIEGSRGRFPVRRIFCVGQNYVDHAREMGSDPDRTPPFFFSKPADAIVANGAVLPFPSRTYDLHHEVELVVALGSGSSDIPSDVAADTIWGWTVGLDLTRRDLQAEAKKAGRPWDMAKGFDQSAPLASLRPGIPPVSGAISLSIDGTVRQTGDLAQMIWAVPEIIANLSTYVALSAGDLIFTGTPAGVGPIQPGETVTATIAGMDPLIVSFRSGDVTFSREEPN